MFDQLRKSFGRLPRVFWIAQTFEMMERGAYYSMVPIIVIHSIYNLGMDERVGGMILAFMYPFQYGLPIFTGALAEKVGYRKQMIFAFIFLTVAYFFLFSAFNTTTMILAAMAVGVGIGSYKPLISATVAKCTAAEDRNLAYGVYYWIVNFAASVFPIVFVLAEIVGILDQSAYRWVFLMGGFMVSINIFTAIFVFEEVPRSGKVKTVADAMNNIKIAFRDYKFVVMVVIIGGFWALYATMLFAVQIIIFGYRWAPAFFTAMFLGIPNPLTIILMGPFISKYIEKVESLRVMLAGLMIYLFGLAVLGLSLAWWPGVIFGIVIASIGEFMVAPGYLAFISKLAPKENVSAYIGCNFISYMIGLLGGTIVFSQVVAKVAVDMQMPFYFYGILISFGLLLFIAANMYYKSWGQDIIVRAKKIREEEDGVKEVKEVDRYYVEPLIFRLYETRLASLIALIMIPIILFTTFSMGTFSYIGPEDEGGGEFRPPPLFDPADYDIVTTVIDSSSGSLTEGESTSESFTTGLGEGEVVGEGQFLKSVSVAIMWEDEPDPILRTNLPDVFQVVVTHEDGWTKTLFAQNQQGEPHTLTVTRELTHIYTNSTAGIGEWDVDITLLNAGDYTAGPRDREVQNDNGNDYSLEISAELYMAK